MFTKILYSMFIILKVELVRITSIQCRCPAPLYVRSYFSLLDDYLLPLAASCLMYLNR